MTKRVIYFTAGEQPTGPELAAIAKLNVLAGVAYEVVVRRGDTAGGSLNYGAGPEPADYVAGTVPTDYNAKTVINPDAPPKPDNLPGTLAIVGSGLVAGVTVTGSGTKLTLTVANGVITAAALSV